MDDTENTYIIRPDHKHKFRATLVQERVHSILADFFSDKEYNTELALEWSQQLADDIKSSLKELGLSRYKYVVQAVIGEQRGAGVKIASRCLWDCDTDQMAQETFMNDSLFCSVMVYGVYFY